MVLVFAKSCFRTDYKVSLLSISFGIHVQKNCKVKQIIYDIINFYFELLRVFSIVKNNRLQHYVNVFNKNIY